MEEQLRECEKQFALIGKAIEDEMPMLAHTLAWRMKQRLEERRLRHPY